MPRLSVSNFSCIDQACVDFGPLTILIGPQASGKSVLCKLTYFFVSIMRDQPRQLAERKSFEQVRENIWERFIEWFPVEAWGKGKFTIEFSSGAYKIRLVRTEYRKKLANTFRISIAPAVENFYNDALAGTQERSSRPRVGDEVEEEVESLYRLERVYRTALTNFLGEDSVQYQLFIPAGRSFFTSIGKAIAAFEQGNVLDPLIVQFGRIYAAYRERATTPRLRIAPHVTEYARELASIFGGVLKADRERDYVVTPDGRKVPLYALSSGQQELLPLMVVLPWVTPVESIGKRMIYVEEPEAHLFPEAQSRLVELFARMVNQALGHTQMVLTTHSPYVLSKINNLLKAGALGARSEERNGVRLETIVPKNAWLAPTWVQAYAIKDRHVFPIVDPEAGLIDADYLDAISGTIAKQFSELLHFEHAS